MSDKLIKYVWELIEIKIGELEELVNDCLDFPETKEKRQRLLNELKKLKEII